MGTYLIVDCETTGLPRDFKAPYTKVRNWPRVVEVAWILYDDEHQIVASQCRIIRPDGFRIPKAAECIHGISTAQALAVGRPIADVLQELKVAMRQATVIVAHNAEFDGKVLAAEFWRLNQLPPFRIDRMVCTMVESTSWCAIRGGPTGYKWPKLFELHRKLFRTSFNGESKAATDAAACARCFFALVALGVIRPRRNHEAVWIILLRWAVAALVVSMIAVLLLARKHDPDPAAQKPVSTTMAQSIGELDGPETPTPQEQQLDSDAPPDVPASVSTDASSAGAIANALDVGVATPSQSKPALSAVEDELIAEEGAPASRTGFRLWTDSTGRFNTRARYLFSASGKVTLEKENGTRVVVQIERLSVADQEYLRYRRRLRQLKR